MARLFKPSRQSWSCSANRRAPHFAQLVKSQMSDDLFVFFEMVDNWILDYFGNPTPPIDRFL